MKCYPTWRFSSRRVHLLGIEFVTRPTSCRCATSYGHVLSLQCTRHWKGGGVRRQAPSIKTSVQLLLLDLTGEIGIFRSAKHKNFYVIPEGLVPFKASMHCLPFETVYLQFHVHILPSTHPIILRLQYSTKCFLLLLGSPNPCPASLSLANFFIISNTSRYKKTTTKSCRRFVPLSHRSSIMCLLNFSNGML